MTLPRRTAWPLDEQVAAARERSPEPWGVGAVTWPLAAAVGSIVLAGLLGQAVDPGRVVGTVLSLGFYGLLVVSIVLAGAPIARRSGGWAAAFGWDRPRWRDLLVAVPALVLERLAQAIAVAVLVIAVPALRDASPSNIRLEGQSTSVVAIVAVLAVVVAPPVEELVFRGLVLRALLRRLSFWPAALVSSVLFGLFHVYQVPRVDGAVLLAVGLTVFGLGQCVLVRYTGRLVPAIAVHALSNAIVLVLSVAGLGP